MTENEISDAEETETKKMSEVICDRCGHKWKTKSNLINVTCTNCSYKTKRIKLN